MKRASKFLTIVACALLLMIVGAGIVACNNKHDNHTPAADWTVDDNSHWHVCEAGGEQLDKADHDLKAVSDGGKHYFKCDVCGYQTKAEDHVKSTTLASDGGYHYYPCTVCGEKLDKELHKVVGNVENYGADGHLLECSECGTVMGDHVYDETAVMSHDAEGHYLQCLFCDEISDKQAHEAGDGIVSNGQDGHSHLCAVCGEKMANEAHSAESYVKENGKHYQECEVCGQKFNEAAHSAINEREFEVDELGHWHVCVCGERLDYAEHEKAAEAPYITNEQSHWYSCAVCLYQLEKVDHRLGEYESDGENHWRVCEVCDRHVGIEACVPDVAAAVDDGDEHYHKCEVCENKVDATAEPYYAMDQTQHWLACTVCDKELGDKTAHTKEGDYGYDAQNHSYVCSECEQTVEAPHVFGDGDQSDVCETCRYYKGLEKWTFEEYNLSSDTSYRVSGYTGDEAIVKLPATDIDGHTITAVAAGVFSGTTADAPHNNVIQELYIPEGYVTMPTLTYCINLKKIHIPSTMSSYGAAFGYTQLEEVYFDSLDTLFTINWSTNSLNSHGDTTNTFSHPKKLFIDGQHITEIVVPETQSKLPNYFLSNNVFDLESITLPKSETFGITSESVFGSGDVGSGRESVRHIPKVIIDIDSYYKQRVAGKWYPNSNTDTQHIYQSEFEFRRDGVVIDEYSFPEDATSVGDMFFFGSESIKKVSLPSSMKYIRANAFRDCANLQEVNGLADTALTTIDKYAFYGCTSLKTALTLPATCTQVSVYAFYGVPTDLYMPGFGINYYSGCLSGWLGESIVLRATVSKWQLYGEDSLFNGLENFKTIYYLGASLEQFENLFAYSATNPLNGGHRAVDELYHKTVYCFSQDDPGEGLRSLTWHYNDQGLAELWDITLNKDKIEFSDIEGASYDRNVYYYNVNNGGQEWTVNVVAKAQSGGELVYSSDDPDVTVSTEGVATFKTLGKHSVKAALKTNETISAMIDFVVYSDRFYYVGTVGGEDVLDHVETSDTDLGEFEQYKFTTGENKLVYTKAFALSVGDTFKFGFLGGDKQYGLESFDTQTTGAALYRYLHLDDATNSFKVRTEAVFDITIDLTSGTPQVSMKFLNIGAITVAVNGRGWVGPTDYGKMSYATKKYTPKNGSEFKVDMLVGGGTLAAWFRDDYWNNMSFYTRLMDGTEVSFTGPVEFLVHGDGFLPGGRKPGDNQETGLICGMSDHSASMWLDAGEELVKHLGYSFRFTFTMDAKGTILDVEINKEVASRT